MNTHSNIINSQEAHLDHDDKPVGRILSRREIIALLGATGAGALLSACTPVAPVGADAPAGDASSSAAEAPAAVTNNETVNSLCVVRPEMAEGPLFVDEGLNRADIRTDPTSGAVSEGVQLDLTFGVSRLEGSACAPLSAVQVDIWQCDALGVYSDTSQLGMQTVGQKFLRGYQITDENGIARFVTIYPGWYPGRTVHIHVKMRILAESPIARETGAAGYDFTTQLFFDDALTDEVFTQAPYNSRGERNIRNENEGIFGGGGQQTLLTPSATETGYAATFDVALDLS